MKSTYRNRLLTTTLFVSASVLGTPAFAQEVQEPVTGEPAQAVDETTAPTPAEEAAGREIVVTGSRIARPNLTSNSPIAVVTGEEAVDKADITLDTFLNTLPQVNPAGTTTSNNPGNGGQSNINLRGLGANRNLVLIDGRRPMSSGTDLSVDLNTIPQGLIERIDVITGGAGATYGADAIAGVVNIIMKDDFQGVDLRATYANALKHMDAREYQVSGVLGANFDEGRGNVAVAAEFSSREDLGKVERPFSVQASSTTGTPPTGRLVNNGGTNNIPQAAMDALFGTVAYGSNAPNSVRSGSRIGFNTDGTLFGVGVFNTPEDTINFRYDPLGRDAAAANQNFYDDFYSYNFDQTNLLVLPLKRKSVFIKGNYEIDPHAEFFIQGGYTEYNSKSGLAATPLGTNIESTCFEGTPQGSVLRAHSDLITCGIDPNTGVSFRVTGLVAPVTNPWIPADLMTLLNARAGDSPTYTGAGAAEGVRIAKRMLDTGLRITDTDNRVLQGLAGLRGDIIDSWRYEVSYSWGRTTIDTAASGNVNVQQAQRLMEDPFGGAGDELFTPGLDADNVADNVLCEGGFNPFGIHPISQDCVEFLNETGFTETNFTLKVLQGFVTGDVVELPAGPLSVVLGAEQRRWRYEFDPGTLFGPIAGFNTATPDLGTNKFTDWFAEARIPILKDAPYAKELELGLSFRHSKSEFVNELADDPDEAGGKSSDNAYGITVSWAPLDELRFRGSYQHSVRAPNFVELFSGGGSFPQYFDPCSITTNFRGGAGDPLVAGSPAFICSQTGLGDGGSASYVQTPGSQAFVGINGNTNLDPETGDTWTVGAVFQKWGFTGSIDYYNIRIKDTIAGIDPNMLIAACYGFHGINPDLDPTNPYCTGISRIPDIASILVPEAIGGDGSGYFTALNQGTNKTSGVDVQLGYNLPTDWLTPGSRLAMNLAVNYLINFKVEELPGVTIDYAGTAAYFGSGLGTSFPEWKGNLNLAWNIKPFTFESRLRYIGKMDNRLKVQFPGEDDFTGPDSAIYVDLAVEADFKPLTLRLGVNNAFDKSPEQYSPNVQSGTDPSLYDVIGRRAYVSARLRF